MLRWCSFCSLALTLYLTRVFAPLFEVATTSISSLTASPASSSLTAAPWLCCLWPFRALSLILCLIVLISWLAFTGLLHGHEYLVGSGVISFVTTGISGLWFRDGLLVCARRLRSLLLGRSHLRLLALFSGFVLFFGRLFRLFDRLFYLFCLFNHSNFFFLRFLWNLLLRILDRGSRFLDLLLLWFDHIKQECISNLLLFLLRYLLLLRPLWLLLRLILLLRILSVLLLSFILLLLSVVLIVLLVFLFMMGLVTLFVNFLLVVILWCILLHRHTALIFLRCLLVFFDWLVLVGHRDDFDLRWVRGWEARISRHRRLNHRLLLMATALLVRLDGFELVIIIVLLLARIGLLFLTVRVEGEHLLALLVLSRTRLLRFLLEQHWLLVLVMDHEWQLVACNRTDHIRAQHVAEGWFLEGLHQSGWWLLHFHKLFDEVFALVRYS